MISIQTKKKEKKMGYLENLVDEIIENNFLKFIDSKVKQITESYFYEYFNEYKDCSYDTAFSKTFDQIQRLTENCIKKEIEKMDFDTYIKGDQNNLFKKALTKVYYEISDMFDCKHFISESVGDAMQEKRRELLEKGIIDENDDKIEVENG